MENKIKKFLKENKKIEVNNKLIKMLGYDDVRDFTKALGDWGHCTDFTYNEKPTQDFDTHIRMFIKHLFLN